MMKKALLLAGLAAAFAFVGCNKETDVKGLDGRKVEIVLTEAQTRTVNDGMSTKWAEGDALSVFYASAGTTEYTVAQFDVTDPTNRVATGTVDLTAESYDWYLFYPYDSHLKTPANTSTGYMTVGGLNQTQKGNDSKEHLAGVNLPIVGVAKSVSASTNPTVSMKHVSSVAAVKVTNDTDQPLTVNTISFTASEDIVGTYYIDFSGETVAFKSSGANYVSNAVTLSVEDGAAIAVGSSAMFYMAVKPFTANVDDELKISVIADQGEVEKTVKLTQAYTFAGGSIKTMNVSYEAPEVIPTITVSDIKEAITSTTQSSPSEFTGQLAGATVSYVNGNNAFIQDETGGILYYKSGHGLKAGDVLSGIVTGKGYIRYGVKQLTSFSGYEKVEGTAPEAVTLTLADLLADYDRYVSVRVNLADVEVTDAITTSDRNGVVKQGEDTYDLYAQVTNTLSVPLGVYTTMIGYPTYHNTTKQLGLWAQDDIVAGDQPFFNAMAEETEVSATTTSVKINVFGNVAWTAEASDGATLDKASGEGEGLITVSFPANEDTENAKEYTVFVRTENTQVENDEFEINITQAKADAAGITSVTIDFSEQGFKNAAEVTSVTENGVTVSFDKGTNSNAPKYYTTGTAVRIYGGGTMTVSADGKTIVSVELTFGSSDGTNEITTNVPTYEEPTWTGEAGSVIFTVGGTTGHRRIMAITVKYNDTDAPVTAASLESIAVSGQTTTFTVGDTFSFDGTVTASYSDGSTKDVTSSATVTAPDLTSAGTKEVTVSYTEGDVTKTATYTVTVNAAASHAGTAEDPFTVADAIAATEALGEGKTSSDKYYIKGLVSTIPESVSNGRATYMISDDGSTVGQMKVYNGYYIGNASFDSADQLQAGDEVIVYGKLQYYKPSSGDSELEISGSYIELLKRGGAAQSAFSAKAGTSTVSANASTVKINVYGNVDWTASVTTPASLDVSSGNGQGVITVSIPENTDTDNDRTFVVTIVSAGFESINLTIKQDKKDASGAITVNATTALGAGMTNTAGAQSCTVDGITISISNGLVSSSDNHIRIYKNATITVTAPSDKNLKKVVFNCTANDENQYGPGNFAEYDGYSYSGKVGTWEGSTNTITLTASGAQVRAESIVVSCE